MGNFLLRRVSRVNGTRTLNRVLAGAAAGTLALLLVGGLIVPGATDTAAAAPQLRLAEADVPAAQGTPGSEIPKPEVPTVDAPAADAPADTAPAGDVPAADVPVEEPSGDEEQADQSAVELDGSTEPGEAAIAESNLMLLAAGPPALGPAEALIMVKTGGTRVITTSNARTVNGLAGVELKLYHPLNGGRLADMNSPVDGTWATCVSDADGNCYFVVPDTHTGGENRDRKFVIVQTQAPSGWYMNSELTVNRVDKGPAGNWPYQYLYNANLRSGSTYVSGTNFMKLHTNITNGQGYNSVGDWQSSLVNPKFVCRVGLRVALVLDLSGSVGDSLGDLQRSAIGFVSALQGTGSSVALYTFAANAPSASGPSGRNYPSRLIDDNLADIKTNINAYRANGATNWDAGIYQVAKSSEQYDLTVVVTDGMPTYFNVPSVGLKGDGYNTQMADIESAIFSANTLKAKADPNLADHTGTRMVVVGVGEGINNDPANLAAVSGQVAYDAAAENAAAADYFQVDWSELEEALSDIAETAICSANVKVVKQVQRDGSDTLEPGGSGWDFGFTTSAGAVWNEAPVATPLGQSRSTNAEGTTEDILLFDSSLSDAVTVSLDELMRQSQIDARWSLQSKTCEINGVPVTPSSSHMSGLQITVGVADKVVCTFVNVQAESLGLKLVKSGWATDDASKVSNPAAMDPAVEEITRGVIRPFGSVVTWTYDVTNQGLTVISDISLVDDRLAAVSCPATVLAPGATMRCTGTGPLFDTRNL